MSHRRRVPILVSALVSGIGFMLLGTGGFLFRILIFPIFRLLPGGEAGARFRTRWVIQKFFQVNVWLTNIADIFHVEIADLPSTEDLKGTLVLATHPAYLDVVVILAILEQASCIVKEQIWNQPLFGGVVRRAGYISASDPEKLIEEGVRALKRGETLLLFPEGTRTSPGRSYKFQRGAAHLALQSGARIVPLLVSCAPPFMAKGQRWYEVPRDTCEYQLRACSPLTLDQFFGEEMPHAPDARQVTEALENYFTREMYGSRNNPA